MAEKALHICLLTYRGNPQSGGQGIYTRLLSRELAAMGHRVDVWSGQPYPELTDGVNLVEIPGLDLWNSDALLRMLTLTEARDPINRSEWLRSKLGEFAEPRSFCARVARRFERLNGSLDYDIVHDNQCLGAGLLDLRKRLPVVATIHHPITKDYRFALESARGLLNLKKNYGVRRWYSFLPMQFEVSRQLEQIFTVSRASADDLEHDYGISRDRLRVVGNGINIEAFGPRPEITRRSDRLITTLSADQPLKGFTFLLDALAELRKTRPALTLKVIGCSEPREVTLKQIRRLGLEAAVDFSGRVETEVIARAYAESTVAVVASLYEGFGFPAGEAMACEVPLVSTTGGALPEVVGESGKAGVLVEPGNAAALARAIDEMLDAPEQRRRAMGEAGRRRVLAQFTWRRAAERTVDGYREAIEKHHGVPAMAQSTATVAPLRRTAGDELAPDTSGPAAEPC